MKMLKKLMALTLCVMLVSSAMVFTAFADGVITSADQNVVITEHNFDSYTGTNKYATHISGKQANREIVTGLNPDNITEGQQIKISYSNTDVKEKFINMFNNDRVGVDGTYKISFWVKAADEASVGKYVYLDVFDVKDDTNGYYRKHRYAGDEAGAFKLKSEWQEMSFEYDYNDVANMKDDCFSLRVMDKSMLDSTTSVPPFTAEECTYTVSESEPIVVLFDDVKVIETKESSYEDVNYEYEEVAFVDCSAGKDALSSGGTKKTTVTNYNYSGDTNKAIKLNTSAGTVYRSRSSSSASGLCDVSNLKDNTTYRYSVMIRLDSESSLTTSTVNILLSATSSTSDKTYYVKKSDTTIYKDGWTKVYTELNTSEAKCTSIVLQTSDAVDSIIIDDFKIEEMTPVIPLETSFAFGEETVTSLEEAGDYTANVKFGKNFANDSATVAFVKYVDGMVADKEVIAQADLANGATKTFNITADELETAQLSVFVWNNINDLFPLIKGLTIAK